MHKSPRSPLAALLPLFAGAVSLLWPTPRAQAEVIRSFDVQCRLQPDTTLDVNETIRMDFENAQRRGIFRIIPVVYDRHGGTYSLPLELISVTDANGNAWKYSMTRQGRDVNIKIGDANRIITGLHTYRIHYLVRRAVNFFEGAPEVYWNATGNDWPFAIESASARFYPPPGVALNQIKTATYRGRLGSTELGEQSIEQDHVMFSTRDLAPGEGLTFVAGLPQGSVTPPSALQTFLWFLADWWPLFLFPLLALSFVGTRYMKAGRDVDGGQAVAVEWNPPKDLTPAEVGTLVDEHCDMADIVSTLIDLAARGYLVIEEIESEKFLFFSSKDYYFKRVHGANNTTAPLLPHEVQFLRGLFGSLDSTTLSSLKEKFYAYLPGIRDAIYESLTEKHLFASNPETTRNAYKLSGTGLLVIGVGGAIFGAGMGYIAYGLGAALAGLIVLMSARAMPAKTATGSRALRECLGFQRFVRLAEKDRIAMLAKDDPTIFGRLLPYAMVLGVADQWADKFKDLMTQPPDWYVGSYGPGHPFGPTIFVNDLGHGMNSMSNTFASTPPPKSTAGGGGSGFSSGGGFSGGGFGGGGGGSW